MGSTQSRLALVRVIKSLRISDIEWSVPNEVSTLSPQNSGNVTDVGAERSDNGRVGRSARSWLLNL